MHQVFGRRALSKRQWGRWGGDGWHADWTYRDEEPDVRPTEIETPTAQEDITTRAPRQPPNTAQTAPPEVQRTSATRAQGPPARLSVQPDVAPSAGLEKGLQDATGAGVLASTGFPSLRPFSEPASIPSAPSVPRRQSSFKTASGTSVSQAKISQAAQKSPSSAAKAIPVATVAILLPALLVLAAFAYFWWKRHKENRLFAGEGWTEKARRSWDISKPLPPVEDPVSEYHTVSDDDDDGPTTRYSYGQPTVAGTASESFPHRPPSIWPATHILSDERTASRQEVRSMAGRRAAPGGSHHRSPVSRFFFRAADPDPGASRVGAPIDVGRLYAQPPRFRSQLGRERIYEAVVTS